MEINDVFDDRGGENQSHTDRLGITWEELHQTAFEGDVDLGNENASEGPKLEANELVIPELTPIITPKPKTTSKPKTDPIDSDNCLRC
ncbi:hypothetical protein BLNAU_22314 [Blattamonas nauphoetae]|uniref:Uncharacterized protein n=1 Tax=Blattamonas nauphoetae TaxID=2049346 RepID=A0ABQ9WUG0_9EUKA|nr:hypothetical protein BLNAU_22314 [Blattamonas nauphoetae]